MRTQSVNLLSGVRLFMTPWTVACQAPFSMEFSRQEYWSGLPCPSPEDLLDPGMEHRFPTLQADSLPSKNKECQFKVRETQMTSGRKTLSHINYQENAEYIPVCTHLQHLVCHSGFGTGLVSNHRISQLLLPLLWLSKYVFVDLF